MDSFYFPKLDTEPTLEPEILSEEEFQTQLDNALALFDLNSELSEQTTLDELSKFHPDVQAEVLDLLGLAFLPPSETEGTENLEPTNFQRNCTRGYACKNSCINKEKQCLNPLQGQARTYGEWLQNAVDSGAALSPAHQGEVTSRGITPTPAPVPTPPPVPAPAPTPVSRQRRGRAAAAAVASPPPTTPTPAPAPTPTPRQRSNPLPQDVRVSNDNPSTGTADYSFKVGRHTVKINFVGSSSRGRNIGDYNDIGVSFSVNGSYSANSNMTKAEQDASSAKLSKIFQHHISRQQKQAIFRCSAATNDGRGAHRAYAYKTMGFSRPVGGTIGSQQVAFVRNGKVDPVKTQKALEIREGNNATFTAQADQRWAQAVQAYQQQRNAARAQRRAAAQAQRTTAA